MQDTYLKLVVAVVGIAAIVFGFDEETTQAIVGGVTALLVFLVPK